MACVLPLSSQVFQDRNERKDPRKSYALIVGTVWGPDDRPVYGVKVKIRRADQKKAKWELLSNHTGEFAQRLPAGKADYIVWADLKGFKPLTGKKLDPGPEVTVHFELEE
ncbi:MAG TPA: carboxypeptidase-like regulatory domain-containing protein, partial [Terriglobales bacterium]|nr:carboxypeptidase-like regulatory domain-containing protein [Terriglobales bacterium]